MYEDLTQNNWGAKTVIDKILFAPNTQRHLDLVTASGIKGPCLWLLYKDLYKGNFDVFLKRLDEGKWFEDIKDALVSNERFRHEWKFENGPTSPNKVQFQVPIHSNREW
jgi:hypothetical protein